jgi:hypothetical protein
MRDGNPGTDAMLTSFSGCRCGKLENVPSGSREEIVFRATAGRAAGLVELRRASDIARVHTVSVCA